MNPLRLPRHLQSALWAHVLRELPAEGVGVLAAEAPGELRALYPLSNVAAQPQRQYLADPLQLLRALRAMERDHLTLGAIYHSHPHGPARPSETDLLLAGYRVPYLIADVQGRVLRAYLLPENVEVSLTLL
ncbi:M67 family metallopeptidase [Deinococcus radiomollis]|uniref:Mov34/MPN/PAD-1 family protein n=1 Tax=Deinococcus radiomollis TaxID=468916 RepID=UPI003891D59E